MRQPSQFRKPALVAVLTAAAAFRLFYALSAGYFVDEDTDWIWLAETISFEPGALNLPLHYQHPALPALVFIDPQDIWPPDGRAADVTAEIAHCALCDPADTRLEEVHAASFKTGVEGRTLVRTIGASGFAQARRGKATPSTTRSPTRSAAEE